MKAVMALEILVLAERAERIRQESIQLCRETARTLRLSQNTRRAAAMLKRPTIAQDAAPATRG
jgi:hypothetical protein